MKRMTGTTCEVYSMREECNGGFTTIFIKAMVRKRFQVLSIKTQLDGYVFTKFYALPVFIKIVPGSQFARMTSL